MGFLRLDRHAEEWELSIVVAPSARRQGLAAAMLALLNDLQGGRRLFAEVLAGNDASHRLFQSAGWRNDGSCFYRKP
jgi:RimJ/RimL family protein N-acetyltransferase